jgi:hypothetical protein
VEQFVSVAEAASILGSSERRVHQMLAEGLVEEAGRAVQTILLRRADVEGLAREGWQGRRSRRSP